MDRRLPEGTCWLRRASTAVVAALWLAPMACAMDPESMPIPTGVSTVSASGGSSVLPLAVTGVALGVAGFLWVRRRQRARGRPQGSITVLDRASMGRGRALSLVRVGDRVVLVGESAQGFQRLCEFEAGDPAIQAEAARRLAS